jgi:hypothetical protein
MYPEELYPGDMMGFLRGYKYEGNNERDSVQYLT